MNDSLSRQFYIETYGCSANRSDSERLLRILKQQSWTRVHDAEHADLVIFNTCGVKQPTERKILRRLREVENLSPWATAVTGCLPNMSLDMIKEAHPNFGVIFDTKSTHDFSSLLTRLEQGERYIEHFSKNRQNALGKIDILPLSFNPQIGILTINEGCDGQCTFCGTKLARGKTLSHSPYQLISQAETMLLNGCQELWVTSQDTGAYKYDDEKLGIWELPELLHAICELPNRFRLRLGMINPEHILRLQFERRKNRLFDVIKQCSQIFSFLHIPVQSGNNRILDLMKRTYTVAEFKKVIRTAKQYFPQVTISTDVIIGFPTETEKEFQDTVNLIKWLRPPVLNISRFGPRPKTLAARMKGQIHGRIAKERTRELTKIWQPITIEENRKWLGWQGQCLVDEPGKQLSKKQHLHSVATNTTVIARNFAYKPIVLAANVKLGSFVPVEIIETRDHYLVGRVSQFKNKKESIILTLTE